MAVRWRSVVVAVLVTLCLAGSALGQAVPWSTYAGNPQHSALSPTAAQPLDRILWQTPVDLDPQYSGTALLAHYGSPLVTADNTVIVPVKTGAQGGFRVEARSGSTGSLIWMLATDYVLPPHNWVPVFGPALTSTPRLYFPGAGGTVYFRDSPDAAVGTTGQLVFYGESNYLADPTAYDASVMINTPITSDASGNIYFGFQVIGSTPIALTSGIARISAAGTGAWVPASTAGNDLSITKVVHNCAPALSPNGQTVYVAVSNGSAGYLTALDSTTLAPVAQVRLKDPKSGSDARLSDNGSAAPTVGPDGDVYYGVLENPIPSNHARGWLLHFDGALSQSKTPGAFGWDSTAAVVPSSLVPSYVGTSSYLLMSKYNNYAGAGGNGQNKVAILDPNATQVEPVTGVATMQEVLTMLGPTPDPPTPGVKEWCINSAAVDSVTKAVMVNSEDGRLYRWDLTSNTLSQAMILTSGLAEAYTPTVIGVDGTVYAINNAVLFAVATMGTPLGAVTNAASGVSASGVTLKGSVTPNGAATMGWFELGTSSSLAAFTQTPGQALGSGTTSVPLAQGLTGLTASTTYYYRAVASSGTGATVRGAIVSFTTAGASTGPPTLTLTYNGKVGDRVGQGNTALGADGLLDGTLTATLHAGGGRTVTKLQLQSDAPGTWDTASSTAFWLLGVAGSLDGALLNAPGSMAVNFAVPDGGSFVVFASDVGTLQFAPGRTLTLTATFSDASTATGVITVTGAGPATLTLTYNGKRRDRVGQGNTALAADGALDGTLTATLSATGGRTVTGLQLQSNAPGTWDTASSTAFWLLGVASGLDGALLNAPGSMAVNFAVANGGTFVVFASDAGTIQFATGRTLTLKATFSDGSTATAVTTVTSTGPATLTLTYNGKLRDRVGQGNTALGADGLLDGTLTATLSAGGGRTVTKLQLQSDAPGTWDTASSTAFWLLGVASGLDGALLNAAGSMAVNFAVADGGNFVVFASDVGTIEFAPGRTLTLTATLSDASTITAVTTVASGAAASLALTYNGKLRDRVGQGNTALAADGALDGTLTATLSAPGGRTVTGLQLQSDAPGTWDTASSTAFWLLGVASGLDGALLNAPGSMAVNFAVANGGTFVVFASDVGTIEFATGRTLTLTATFSDGTTATAVTTAD